MRGDDNNGGESRRLALSSQETNERAEGASMPDDFLGPPKTMMREYLQHGLLLLLDTVFMLFWVGLQALYHLASEWVIDKAGFGVVDGWVKLAFDAAFGLITFFWVVRTVWRVHSDAYHHGRRRRTGRDKGRGS